VPVGHSSIAWRTTSDVKAACAAQCGKYAYGFFSVEPESQGRSHDATSSSNLSVLRYVYKIEQRPTSGEARKTRKGTHRRPFAG